MEVDLRSIDQTSDFNRNLDCSSFDRCADFS